MRTSPAPFSRLPGCRVQALHTCQSRPAEIPASCGWTPIFRLPLRNPDSVFPVFQQDFLCFFIGFLLFSRSSCLSSGLPAPFGVVHHALCKGCTAFCLRQSFSDGNEFACLIIDLFADSKALLIFSWFRNILIRFEARPSVIC